MSPVAFDTLAYARRLADAGVPQDQADAHAEALAAAVGPHLVTKADLEPLATKEDLRALEVATKEDLRALEVATREEIHALSADLHEIDHRLGGRITDLERRLDVGLTQLETRLTLRMGALVGAGLGVMTALNRLL